MMLAPQYTQRVYRWTAWKAALALKGGQPQYEEGVSEYGIWFYDGPEVHICTIWKGTVPDPVLASYSQAQNDTDKTDFETNFKPYANRSVDDIPSLIIANSIKNGGNSNLGVNGSVTPVVFEYNPPNNYDIQVTALSFLFEDTGAFGFGNTFVIATISTLTNGLLLEAKAGDVVVSPWQNMKRTRDLIEISQDFSIVTGTTNFLRVRVHLPHALVLSRAGTFATADYLRVTVRDNLSTIDFGEAHFQGVKL